MQLNKTYSIILVEAYMIRLKHYTDVAEANDDVEAMDKLGHNNPSFGLCRCSDYMGMEIFQAVSFENEAK